MASDAIVLGRRLGAALGAVGGPAAGLGAGWGGLGDTRAHVWAIAILVGAALGGLTWRIFLPAPEVALRPGLPFALLFAGVVGMLAGGFAAFPLGGVFGLVGGVAGGLPAVLSWRATSALGAVARPLAAAGFGMGGGLVFAAWWTA